MGGAAVAEQRRRCPNDWHAHFSSVVGDLGFRLHLADARPIAVGLGQRGSTSAVNPGQVRQRPLKLGRTPSIVNLKARFRRVVRTPRGRR